MATYTGNSTIFEISVFIIDESDPIEHGVDGIDSIPNENNQDRKSYLKKYKGRIIIANGEPTGNYSLQIDSDLENSLLYLDQQTASFWKPTVTGTDITSWTNITKNVILNIKEIRINETGDDSTYIKLSFNDNETKVYLTNYQDRFANILANRFIFTTAEGNALLQTYTSDDEVQINSDIETDAQNSDSKFSVKRYTLADVQENVSLKWNETSQTWELINDNDDLLNINIGNVYQNGVLAQFIADVLITNQAEFDDIFNTDIDGGETIFDDPALSGENDYLYIYIKAGTYTLTNTIKSKRNNLIIECAKGAIISLDSSLTGKIIFQIGEDDSGSTTYKNNCFKLNIDGNTISIDTLLKSVKSKDSDYYFNLISLSTTNIFADGIYSNNNSFKIKYLDVPSLTNNINEINNSYIEGNVNIQSGSKVFNDCENLTINAMVNNEMTLATGDFNE